MSCNFCGNPKSITTYNKPVDWQACSECVLHVIKQDYIGLLNRMYLMHAKNFPEDYQAFGALLVKRYDAARLSYFMEARGTLPF